MRFGLLIETGFEMRATVPGGLHLCLAKLFDESVAIQKPVFYHALSENVGKQACCLKKTPVLINRKSSKILFVKAVPPPRILADNSLS